jgi:CubicO group peptidase (beta-lactamase class C family)
LPRDAAVDFVYEHNTVIHPSAEEILASLKETALIAAPMTKKQYSNLGFALLGLVLEHIAEQSYTHYVTEHILHPLGMASSGFAPMEAWPPSLQAHVATPYKPQREDEMAPEVAPVTVSRGKNPAGGLYSSVEDMARFLSLQFLDGPAGGKHILKGSTLREMRAPVFVEPGWNAATAISWSVERMREHTIMGHNGGLSGFSADVLIVPTLKLGLALFVNTTAAVSELNRAVLERALPTFNRPLQRQQRVQKKPASSLPPQSLE